MKNMSKYLRRYFKRLKRKKVITKVMIFKGYLHRVTDEADDFSEREDIKILGCSITQGHPSYHDKEPFVLAVTYSTFE